MGWPRSPKFLHFLMPPLLSLNAIPFFLLGLVLVYVFAFRLGWFPLLYGYTPGSFPEWSFSFVQDVLYHSILPALSIILVSIGGWALSMRSMMVTTHWRRLCHLRRCQGPQGQHHLRPLRDPQRPAAADDRLGLALGQVIAGTIIVEVIFSYPGIGKVLFTAIRGSDYFLVQGIVFMLILAIGITTLILDFIYPLIDPRITYTRN